MTYTPKTWQNDPNHSTPLGASGLNDLESRIDTGFDDAATATAAAQAASQPLDSDLTAIAALSTTSFGRALLALADAAAGRTALAAAPLASPTFTGTPAAPTPSAADNSTKLATTAYVDTADAFKAPLASPALTGHPTGVTESANDNSTRLASTAYADAVKAALAGVYVYELRTTGRVSTAGAAGTTYLAIPANLDQTAINASAAPASSMPVLRLVATDLAVTGLTAKLRLRASVLTIATAPAITITIGLYPLTIASSLVVPGTVVAASTVAIASPGANAITAAATSDFTLPTDGPYAIGYTLSGTPTAAFTLQAQIQSRAV